MGAGLVKVAVYGSRKFSQLERVDAFMDKLWEKHGREMTLVSGGADGVDKRAETRWLEHGGEVHSYRIKKLRGDLEHEDEYGIEVWVLQTAEDRRSFVYVPGDQPTFANAVSALNYRSMLLAEVAERGVGFWDGRSRGTVGTIDAFHAEKKPNHVFREEASDGTQS